MKLNLPSTFLSPASAYEATQPTHSCDPSAAPQPQLRKQLLLSFHPHHPNAEVKLHRTTDNYVIYVLVHRTSLYNLTYNLQ